MADDIQTLGTYEVFPFLPNFISGIEKAVLPAFNIIEYPGTVPTVVSTIERRPISFTKRITLDSHEDIYTFLDFVGDHKGRRNKFWYFLRTNDFTLKNNASSGSTDLDIEVNGYTDNHVSTDRVYWLLNSGDIIARRITLATYDALNSKIVLTITPSIDRDLNVSDIMFFGRVLMVRFDIDKFSVKYHANSVAEVNLRFTELPKEYPAT